MEVSNIDLNIHVLTNKDVNDIANENKIKELTPKQISKLDKVYNKHKIKSRLIIERVARKTVRYIEKNTINFPKENHILRDRIISSCYTLLENVFRANVFQETCYKKEIVIQIQMLNFYLEEAYIKNILTEKKFISYTNHLLKVDKMVRSWMTNEKKK